MGKLGRRFNRKSNVFVTTSKSKIYTQRDLDDAVDKTVLWSIAVACNIVLNNFNDIRKKDTRLKVMTRLFEEQLNDMHVPSEQQKATERQMYKEVGWIVTR